VNARSDLHEVACFLGQQAAEKGLKAFLYLQGEDPVLGHSLFDLTRRVGAYASLLTRLREAAKTLDGYYVPSRYPNGLTDDVAPLDFFAAEDSERALTAARTILDAIASHLPASVTVEP
jgi:HEPN domain-containing protein